MCQNQNPIECLGCRLALAIDPVHIIYETKSVTCILDIEPFQEGHTLILPKRHLQEWTERDPQTSQAITEAAAIVSKAIQDLYKPDGITICQNGGVFNELGHFHLHVIPRYEGDGFTWSEPVFEHRAGERLAETGRKIVHAIRQLTSEGGDGEYIRSQFLRGVRIQGSVIPRSGGSI